MRKQSLQGKNVFIEYKGWDDFFHPGTHESSFSETSEKFYKELISSLIKALYVILDEVYSGIIVCNDEGRVLYINRFYADLLRTDPKKAIGRHIREFFPTSRIPEVLEKGQAEIGQKCSLRTDINLLVNRIPIKYKGKTIGVVLQTVFKNYTEVNQLMTRLNLLEQEVSYYKRGLTSMLSALYTFEDIVGESHRIVEAKKLARRYAMSDASVLIVGPTGSGKELFAHAIHLASRRSKGPFVCVNCGAIPKELLESELFGYEPGAFTGAKQKGKPGKIELTHGGTLFLDEIGDLPISAQCKLLRVLETKQIERVGSIEPFHVDFRLIAATNRNLKEMIVRDEFREDLYYRLNAMTVEVPPLKERTDDIPLLVKHLLYQMGRPGFRVTPEALRLMELYEWPGNIRELKNIMERAISLADGSIIDVEHLPLEMRRLGHRAYQRGAQTFRPLPEELASYEKHLIEEALHVTGNNRTQAAKLLGISRSTLYEKCKIYGL